MRIAVILLCFFASAWGQPPAVTVSTGAPNPKQPQPEATQYKPEELCTVEGIVRNSATGEPLKKANISLFPMNSRGQSPPATTVSGPDGKFAMKSLEPGQYRLSADRPGFVRMEYGAKPGSMQSGTTLTLSKAQSMTGLELRMSPHSVVTGRILDEDGDPVQNVQVLLSRHAYWQGQKRLIPAGSASTNDLGEYRIFGVAPGKYYVYANRMGYSSNYGVDRSANTAPGEDVAPTYFPGTTDIASASLIPIPPARVLQGIDMTLRKTRTYRIKGAITGISANPNRGGMVILQSKDSSSIAQGFGFDTSMGSWRGPGNEFELKGVRPGSYYLQASYQEPPNLQFSGRVAVDVVDQNLTSVAVPIGPGIDVEGSIRVEGQGSIKLEELMIFLQPKTMGMMMMGQNSGSVKEGGVFKISGVSHDSYTIRVNGAPGEYYLKSARLGQIDALDQGLDLGESGGAAGLELVLSANAASVEGSVADEKGNPIKGAVVLLHPSVSKPATIAFLQKSVTSDQNGQFKIPGITPGEYNLIAFDGVDQMEFQDPEFFQQHEAKGVRLQLKESAKESRDLKVVVVETAQ